MAIRRHGSRGLGAAGLALRGRAAVCVLAPVEQTAAMSDVVDNESEHRFELHEEGRLAELVYDAEDGRLVLVHTGLPDELGGRGLGGVLVRAALERARRDNLTIVPRCPFARSWLEKHPDETTDVTIDWTTKP
jgi:predicted GNAT family acetyltransferase